MPDITSPYEQFGDYFSPAELTVLNEGRGLPLIAPTLDRLCLDRISTIVLNALVEGISPTTPLKAFALSSAPHPYILDGAKLEVALGVLPDIPINDSWAIDTRVGVPSTLEGMDLDELHNPEPLTHGIRDPRGIVFASLGYRLTEAAYEKLDDSEIVEPDQTAYDEALLFTRVEHTFGWETKSANTPLSEQIAFMAQVGFSANIELPFAVKRT